MGEQQFGVNDFCITTKQPEKYTIFDNPEDSFASEMFSSMPVELKLEGSLEAVRGMRKKVTKVLEDRILRDIEDEFRIDDDTSFSEKEIGKKEKGLKKKSPSRLDAEGLKSKCDKIIAILNEDIETYLKDADDVTKKARITTSESKENMFSDYLLVIKACRLADERDVKDFEELRKCLKASFDGTSSNNSSKESFKQMCSYLFKTGTSAIATITFLLDRTNIDNTADDYAKSKSDDVSYYYHLFKNAKEKRKKTLNAKKEFKAIERGADNLFENGKELRKIADMLLEKMNQKLNMSDYSSKVSEDCPELMTEFRSLCKNDNESK